MIYACMCIRMTLDSSQAPQAPADHLLYVAECTFTVDFIWYTLLAMGLNSFCLHDLRKSSCTDSTRCWKNPSWTDRDQYKISWSSRFYVHFRTPSFGCFTSVCVNWPLICLSVFRRGPCVPGRHGPRDQRKLHCGHPGEGHGRAAGGASRHHYCQHHAQRHQRQPTHVWPK